VVPVVVYAMVRFMALVREILLFHRRPSFRVMIADNLPMRTV
jgi:hypothetical protein